MEIWYDTFKAYIYNSVEINAYVVPNHAAKNIAGLILKELKILIY